MSTRAPPHRRRWLARALLLVLGWIAVALAVVGVALPLVPTTPFVLLAAACFARSSPRLYRRLLASEHLGPLLVQWRERRSVPRSAKLRAYALVVVSFSVSIVCVDELLPRILLAVLGCGLLAFLMRLRTEPPHASARAQDPLAEDAPPPARRERTT